MAILRTRPTRTCRAIVHSSPIVKAGPLIFLSGQLPISPLTGLVVENYEDVPKDARHFATGHMSVDGWTAPTAAQIWQTYENIAACLRVVGLTMDDLVLLNTYTRKVEFHFMHNAIRGKSFDSGVGCPNTGIQSSENPLGALFQAKGIAIDGRSAEGWKRRVIDSELYGAVSDYSIGVQTGPILWFGDFVPADARSGQVIASYGDVPAMPRSLRRTEPILASHQETVLAQSWWLFDRISAVLEENSSGLDRIAKLVVYLVNGADAIAYSAVHSAVFGEHAPVASFVVADWLGRPEFRVAIEVIAAAGDSSVTLRPIRLVDRPPAIPGTADGVAIGPVTFVRAFSGRAETPHERSDRGSVAGAETTAGFVDARTEALKRAAYSALRSADTVLRSGGASLRNAVAVHFNVRSMGSLSAIDHVLLREFGESPPAVTVVGARELSAKGSQVDVEVTATTNGYDTEAPVS